MLHRARLSVAALVVVLVAAAGERRARASCDAATEVDFSGSCYYLDGSGGKCDAGYALPAEGVLDTISPLFAGKTYKHNVSDNCCVRTADPVQNWGFASKCNAPGAFGMGDPSKGGAGCIAVMVMAAQQLTLC